MFVDINQKEDFHLLKKIGVRRVEIYTHNFASEIKQKNYSIIQAYQLAAQSAKEAGLEVNAGHDLSLANIRYIVELLGLKEVSIGHAIIADSLIYGLRPLILAYKNILSNIPNSNQ